MQSVYEVNLFICPSSAGEPFEPSVQPFARRSRKMAARATCGR